MQASIGWQTLGTVKPKFNLFDFKQPMQSSIGWVSVNTPKAPIQATIGGKSMPTITQKQPVQQATVWGLNFQWVAPSINPKTVAQPTTQQDIIKAFYDNPNIPDEDKKLVSQAIDQGMNRADAEKYLTTDYSKKDLLLQPKETTWNIATQSFWNLIWWAISQAPNIVGQAGSFFIGKPVDFALKQAGINVPSLSEHFKQAGLDDKAKLQEVLGVDPESFFTKVWQFGAEIGSLATGTGEAKIIAKIGEKAPAVAKGLQQLSQKAPKTYEYLKMALIWENKLKTLGQKVIKWVTSWAKEMAKYDIISKGEITPEGVGIGAWLWAALPVAWKVLSKTWEYVARKLPANLQLSWLLNPTKLNQVNDALIQEGQKTPENVWKWMIDRGMKGSKQDIVWKLEAHAEQSKKAVDDTLATIDATTGKTYRNDTVRKALEQISNDLDWVAWMEAKKLEIDTLLSKWEYTLTDANKAKRLIDEQYNLYKISGGETAWTKAQWMRNVRQDIRKFIEDTAEANGAGNIRLLNNETSVAKWLSEAIARKDITDYARELLSPFAGWVIWGLYGNQVWPFKWDDYASRVWNVIVWALIGKGLASTTVKTNVASMLNKFSKQEIWALEDYINSGWSKKLSEELKDKFNKETQLLLPAPWESSYKSPAIITPQTMEKAVIQESKIPLKNTKYGNTKPNNTPGNNAIPSVSSSTTSNSIPKPTNLTTSNVSNGNKKIVKETSQPTKAPKLLKKESGDLNIADFTKRKQITNDDKIADLRVRVPMRNIRYWDLDINGIAIKEWDIVRIKMGKDTYSKPFEFVNNKNIAKYEVIKPKPLSNNSWFINPTAIAKDIKKLLPKKIEAPKELIEEARKYKSAEEFIKNRWETLYHWTNSDSKDFVNTRLWFNEKDNASKWWVWFSDSISTAKSYWKNTKQAKINTKNFNSIDADWETYWSFVRELEDAIKEAKIEWKDWLIIKNFSDRKDWGEYDMATHYVVFNRDTIKTPEQLRKIWEQANK